MSMSILPVKRLFCAVLFIALSNSVYAANICGPDAVDPDDDGWGWENGQSCRINAVEPPAHTRCTNPDSDPDGDGWGWENGASCKVDAGPGGPGTDFDNAGRVQLNSSITGTFNGTGQHYYTFNVAENSGIELDTSFLLNRSIEAVVSTRSETQLNPAYEPNSACLVPGTYFLLIDRQYVDTNIDIDYTVTIKSTDLNCVSPDNTLATAIFGDYIVTTDGSIFFAGYSTNAGGYIFSKLDNSGNTI